MIRLSGLSAYVTMLIKTPKHRSMAKEGILFRNASGYNSNLCTVRATILTECISPLMENRYHNPFRWLTSVPFASVSKRVTNCHGSGSCSLETSQGWTIYDPCQDRAIILIRISSPKRRSTYYWTMFTDIITDMSLNGWIKNREPNKPSFFLMSCIRRP